MLAHVQVMTAGGAAGDAARRDCRPAPRRRRPPRPAVAAPRPAPEPARIPAMAGAAAAPALAAGVDPADPGTWGTSGRNDPCPCGSGKKYKHCHGRV